MSEKISGYILLAIGLLIIIFSGFNIWSVFTKRVQPVQIFKIPGPTLDINQLLGGSLPPEIANQVKPKSSQGFEILPGAALSDIANLTAHVFLMSFFLNIGFKVAQLGVQLLRSIQVKLKASGETENA